MTFMIKLEDAPSKVKILQGAYPDKKQVRDKLIQQKLMIFENRANIS